MNARTLMLIASIALLATPALARDGSKTATDHSGTNHGVGGKDSGFQQLKGELKTLQTTTYPELANVIENQFGGDVQNALDPDYNGGKAAITEGQAKSLEKAFDRATTGTDAGIGGIP
jgi:hypothetical protein